MKWVLGHIVTQQMGLTAGQLRGMVQRGTLERGRHFMVLEHKTFFDLEAMQQWLDTEASRQKATAYKLTTRCAEPATGSSWTNRPPIATSRMRLGSARG